MKTFFVRFSHDVIELQYSVPSCEVCFLYSDCDFQMLFCGARVYKLDCVENSVSKIGGSCSKMCSVDSCSEVLDEDDYLGEAFWTEVHKSYLSDKCSSFIYHVGQKFHGAAEFREKLRKYAIAFGFEFVFLRNDLDRIYAVCSNVGIKGCDWHLCTLASSANGFLYIRELYNIRNCKGAVRTQKHKLLGSKVVKTGIAVDVMYNLSLNLREIMSKFKSTYEFDISYKVSLKAKQRAKERIYGFDADSNMLSWYKEAVLESNPSSSFVLEVDPSTNHFEKLFVAYGGCVEGFQLCLPVLYVGDTFGKSIYKDQILFATKWKSRFLPSSHVCL